MRVLFFIAAIVVLNSCNKDAKEKPSTFSSVEIEDILNDSTLSVRAIELFDDKSLAFAANDGVFGLYKPTSNSWMISTQTEDSIKPHFRAVAHTSTDFFMLSIDNPALLYKTGDNSRMKIVYKEEGPLVFYDAMTFWNDQEGIAIGDPVDGCLSIIITRDGGTNWSKISCDKLPKLIEGEAAFAASNTNISVVGDHTWIGTGGKVSRVWYSPNKGKSWKVFDTPMINGASTSGIYSLQFYNEKNGFAIGGDYTKPEENAANKIVTNDGGKTWNQIASGENPGYRSCVQYIPSSKAKKLVAVGFNGIDYSNDTGETWKHLSEESFYTIRFLNDSVAYAAGKGRISKLYFK